MNFQVAKTDRDPKKQKGVYLTDQELEHKFYNYKKDLTNSEKVENHLFDVKGFLIALRDGYANTSTESINNTIAAADEAIQLLNKH